MQLDPIQLCGRHSRPRPQILESSTGAVDMSVNANTDHAAPTKRHNHGCGARNLTQTLRSRRDGGAQRHIDPTTNTRPGWPCCAALAAGQILQIEGTWRVSDPLPFGLDVVGDSALPVGQG